MPGVGTCTKSKLTLRTKHLFVLERSVEDVKQDEKSVLDLLESIMKPSGLANGELRRISCKLSQFRPNITKIRACTFHMSEKIRDSSKASPQATLFAIFGRASGQIFEKMRVFGAGRRLLLQYALAAQGQLFSWSRKRRVTAKFDENDTI